MVGWNTVNIRWYWYCHVLFLYDPDNPKHKHPTIDCEDALTHGIEFGCGLGQWEDEFKHGEYITDIGVGGAKSYAYRTSKNAIVIEDKRY